MPALYGLLGCHCSVRRLFLCAEPRQNADRPLAVEGGFNLPRRLSSSEFLHFNFRLSPFKPKHHLPRFLPSSRYHRRHQYTRYPTECFFRPQVFSTSRRLNPPPTSRAYSIPQPRPGFSVQGFLPPRSHPPSSGGASPLSLKRNPLPARAGATVNALDFEALLYAKMRSSETGFSRHLSRSPQQFSPSRGFPLPHREPGSPGHPLVAFSNEAFTFVLARLDCLQCFVGEKVGLPVARLPAPSRFRAFH